ncbi:hypothetical protein CTAYLR_001827 [Chrysophaeum taylorii]|uniref:ABC1 atypical kinase-like domain-containing protein n=1 Tax=Chrysophaeum taylorii TaxID=2483200 RepID=A0AAD7U8T6_9STRA|nr:hypothetical protein CTAYLR_001827 [Chrysophaeum taylorii]
MLVIIIIIRCAAALIAGGPGAGLGTPTKVEHPVLEPILLSSETLDAKLDKISAYYATKPWLVARRLGSVGGAVLRVAASWVRSEEVFNTSAARLARSFGQAPPVTKRGAALRSEVSRLGVVFIKLAQTLATRPDIIGEEAACALESLQDQNEPFDDALAKAIIDEDLGSEIELTRISEKPVAAASLAQVYRAHTAGGADVALKVRRPKVVEQVALDCHAVRIGLGLLQAYWGSNSTDYPGIVDEVTAGLFRELDFRLEALTAPVFWAAHIDAAPYLRVPRAGTCPPVTTRLHLAEWVDAATLQSLPRHRQRDMVAKGLDVCFLQLFGTGMVHADPHLGNVLFDPHDHLVLLDFGLTTTLAPKQTEAMAIGVAAIVKRDWGSLLDAFRDMGLVPKTPFVWVDRVTGERADGLSPGVWRACDEAEFSRSFVEALQGAEAISSFTDITTRLTRLALSYQFVLPPWLLFVVRAVITLDGFAASMDPPLSALEAAAPHAARRVLSPATPVGERYLRAALLDETQSDALPRLKVSALSGLASQTTTTSSSSSQKTVVATVLNLLLEDADGRALRRLVRDIDPRPLARVAAATAATAAFSLRPVPAPVHSALRLSFGTPRVSPARSAVAVTADGLGSDDHVFAPPPGLPVPTPSWRARRVRNLLLATHAKTLATSPSSLASLVVLAASFLVLVVRSLVETLLGRLRARAARAARWAKILSWRRRRSPPPRPRLKPPSRRRRIIPALA